MKVDGKWIGYGLGDVDAEIVKIKYWLFRRFSYAKKLDASPLFDAELHSVIETARNKLKLSNVGVLDGLWNLELKYAIGYIPKPPPPRHAMLTVRGTGGVVGEDYTSQLARASWNHFEVPMLYAASMGGIPVAAATDIHGLSGNECAEELYNMIVGWVLSNTGTFSVSAYSLGTKGVHRFLNDLTDPNHPLFKHLPRLVSVILIGDPWRPFGRSFWLGPIPSGQGIGTPSFTLSQRAIDTLGYRVCWLTNPADMYANSPLGGTGEILNDVQNIILATKVSDPLGTMGMALTELLAMVRDDSGLDLGSMGTSLLGSASTGNVGALGFMLLPMLVGGFQGLIAGVSGNGSNLPKGPAAIVQAGILALKFYGSGIAGHVHYHDTPWGIGPQTFLELGIQHANDWGKDTAVLV